jgi:hypothetical protein
MLLPGTTSETSQRGPRHSTVAAFLEASRNLPFPDDVRGRRQEIWSWKSKREDETGWRNLVCFFSSYFASGLLICIFRDALNRASVVPSRTSSPTQPVEQSRLNVAMATLATAEVGADLNSLHSSGRGCARYGEYHLFTHSKFLLFCTHGVSLSLGFFWADLVLSTIPLLVDKSSSLPLTHSSRLRLVGAPLCVIPAP